MSRRGHGTKPTTDDHARVIRARQVFGLPALVAKAGVSEASLMRVLAGEAVKPATLRCVVRAADELAAERARKLQPSAAGPL